MSEQEQVTDVLVVGFGAAGACAAVEAADAGADVLVLDRFSGGGATALSGGIVYAGGGTPYQEVAGVTDTVDAMVDYLKLEVGDAVSEDTLRRFCAGSRDMIGWLAGLGVPFEGSLCPYKTSYPSDKHYLYYSGSEAAGGFRDAAVPAPRGHRVKGPGTSGKVLFAKLAAAVRGRGVRVLPQTRVTELVTDPAGRVTGVRARTLAGAPALARARHRLLSRYAAKPGIYLPKLRAALDRRASRIEAGHAREISITARHGVVLAAGGFVLNRTMLREHAPAYRGGLPLGTVGDDGSGITLGVERGAATRYLDHVSAWRFITPPTAFGKSLLVDTAGARVCDESRYGAALGHALITEHGGRGWLLVDAKLVREARSQLGVQTLWFQRMQAEYLLRKAIRADSIDELAKRAGIDAEGLIASVVAHNAAAAAGTADPTGKPAEFVTAIDEGPYALLDVSIRPSIANPCPMLTLGGLVVDERTGAVLTGEHTPIPGLYAAGRTAAGLCANSYVSGLSLADCVFSGRRAGSAAAKPVEVIG
ncbi:MAG TPA: FAD-binding protein [Pseudonocardiaceae bacterium]|jgi:3-oxo-5alpha-steroid 4-dehydrogenase|nr:FAD-binding protein [Pseudonocardiaceae bacterium]